MSAAGSPGCALGPAHNKESQQRESNPRPTDYESVALPLSYTGSLKINFFETHRN